MALNPEITREIRVMRKALDMIEENMNREDPPHVDDRDESYSLAELLAGKATKLADLIGNTTANDSQAMEVQG